MSTSHEDAPSGLVNEVTTAHRDADMKQEQLPRKTYLQVENGTQDAWTLWLRVLRDPGGLTLLLNCRAYRSCELAGHVQRCFIRGYTLICFKQSLLHMLSDKRSFTSLGPRMSLSRESVRVPHCFPSLALNLAGASCISHLLEALSQLYYG